MIVAVSRGSEPVASMALRGATMPAGVLQGIANLVAIGLERARAQDLAQQIEATRQSEQLRTTLIDAMAHEFKTHVATVLAQRKRRSDAGTEVGPAGDFGLQLGRKRTESGLSSFVGCASLTTGFSFASKETDTPPIRRPGALIWNSDRVTSWKDVRRFVPTAGRDILYEYRVCSNGVTLASNLA